MITREDVADLQRGDVVELARAGRPDTAARGTVAAIEGRLYAGPYCVRLEDGDVPSAVDHLVLTVVARAPRRRCACGRLIPLSSPPGEFECAECDDPTPTTRKDTP